MTVRVRNTASVTVIDCKGEVDLYSSPRLRDALVKSIHPSGPDVLVNMSQIVYIDSSGIATLVEALQLSRRTKTRFGLFGARSNAQSVLELARLDKVFNIFKDEQDALARISTLKPFDGL